jgi:hypothetical protein
MTFTPFLQAQTDETIRLSEANREAMNNFMHHLASETTRDIGPHFAFTILRQAATMRNEVSRSHLLDAISTELQQPVLPPEVKQTLRVVSEPSICGPAARELLSAVFFSVSHPTRPGEHYIAMAAKEIKDRHPLVILTSLFTAQLTDEGLIEKVRADYNLAKRALG